MCDGAADGGGEGEAEVKGIPGEGVGLWRHPAACRGGGLRGLIMLQGIHSGWAASLFRICRAQPDRRR